MKSHHRWAATALFVAASSISTLTHAAPISGQGTWETTLQARYFDAGTTVDGYYDTVLNITWKTDLIYPYGGSNSYIWANANYMAAGQDINGITGWRLPTISPIDGTTTKDANVSYIGTQDQGSNVGAPGTLYSGSTASEMAHMF